MRAPRLNPADRGAASEMVVCLDLLARGFHVFRSVSPSCPFNLAAFRDGACLRVEVRTGTVNPATGTLSVSLLGTDRFDVLAVVVGTDAGYLPALAEGEVFPWRMTEASLARMALGPFLGQASSTTEEATR